MASEVEICNDALARIGDRFITALDENSTAARLCLRQFPVSRDQVLTRYPWNCATGRARLAASTTPPAWGFPTAFPLPADCLRVVQVGEAEDALAWRVEGREILADGTGPLDVIYIRRLEDVGLWSPNLADAVAARLAARIAFGLTGNATLAANMEQLAERAFVDAKRIDAIEQSQDEEVSATMWTDARFTSYGPSARRMRGSTVATPTAPPSTGPSTVIPVYGP